MKATKILRNGFSFKVGRGDASFWYSNWLGIGPLYSLVEFVNIHDVNLTIRDVFTTDAWQLDHLWTLVPQDIRDSILAKHLHLHDEDVTVWETTYASISLANVVKKSFDFSPNVREPRLVRWEAPVRDQFVLNTDERRVASQRQEARVLTAILTYQSGTIGTQFIMKFLECAPLDRLNDFLSNLNLGERTIKGCLEAYSCKHAGTDKKLSISLENEIIDYLGKSSDTDSSSPDEPLLTRTSRRTLVYLVLTLYHMYPDYDFSAVKAHQFFTEESWDSFKQIFDSYMFEASKEWDETVGGVSLLEALFKALDEVVKLVDCEIYGYVPDSEADPLPERGAIWSFNFLFYNRKLKRIVTFRFSCFSNLIADGFLVDEIHNEYDEEIFADMDI
ncbi:Repressor of RNA polymerase III transcription Maf1 [Sesbania bispinosa]|nr:Repressor of RNA polymerase III transcription Maf1 [Sesbania bispinosa]